MRASGECGKYLRVFPTPHSACCFARVDFSVGALMLPGEPAWRIPGPPQINASNCFIAPESRQYAMLMARHSTPDPRIVYTALTPIPSASRILRRIGFKAICCQTILGLTPPLFRLPGTGARILGAAEALAALAADPVAPALIDHQCRVCLVAALDTGDALLPLVFRPRRRWLPAAGGIDVHAFADWCGCSRKRDRPGIYCPRASHDGIRCRRESRGTVPLYSSVQAPAGEWSL